MPKNDYFGASASYERAITAKIGRIIVNHICWFEKIFRYL